MAKKHPTHVSKPVYPGGMAALRKFVSDNLKYPPSALEHRVEGTVTVRYSLDYRGKVVEVKLKEGIGYGCDEEAMRVVKLLRFEVPQARKKKVRIHQNLNIHFNLPTKASPAIVQPTPPARPTVNYVSVPATKGEEKAAQSPGNKSGGSYTYTVRLD